ncbi:hypothetical protein ccbrp13_32950 [Ktedonobacteria bacterium brp13]|nr:hypothetical protein ccbrp13_32950 [Ktedonobacteria bacterium brp13]
MIQATSVKAFHLSHQQTRLWSFLQASSAYRSLCAILLEGALDGATFLRVCQRLVDRHDILRTSFDTIPDMDVPLQLVVDSVEVSCSLVDLEALSATDQHIQSQACFAALQSEQIDLQDQPLFSFTLLRLAGETHILLLALPALCADNSTLIHLLEELSQEYSSYPESLPLIEDPLQYVDVAAWQESLLRSEDADLYQRYWRELHLPELDTVPVPFVREYSLTDERTSPFLPQQYSISLEENLSARLLPLARQQGISLQSWLLTCWLLTLSRMNNESEVLVGVTCDGRFYEELATAIGLYSRVVPFNFKLADDLTFAQVAALVDTSLSEAIKRQSYFSWELLKEDREGGPTPPFFPICFEYTAWPAHFTAGTLHASLYQQFSCIEPFVLKLHILQSDDSVQAILSYDPQYLAPKHISRLGSALRTLFQSAVEQPQHPATTLPVLTPREQEALLQQFQSPAIPIPNLCFHQLFEQEVRRHPEHLAVLDGREQMTYAQLNARANQLARVLQRAGVGPNVLVGLCLARGVSLLVGLLGILKAGGAYVPLDPEYPTSQLQRQLQVVQVPLLLTQRSLQERLAVWLGPQLYLEDLTERLGQEAAQDLPSHNEGEDIASVIFTSGSTGQPKGVLVRQQSLVNYTQALSRVLGSQPGWQYATVTTLAADLGNTAIFGALTTGGTVHLLDYATVTSTMAYAAWVQQHPIDVLKIVPSHLAALLSGEQARAVLPREALVLGGEALGGELVQQIAALSGRCQVYNHYGPTETTIGVLVKALGVPQTGGGAQEVTLGRPLTNTRVVIRDRRGNVVPIGVTGEVYVGGAGLAQGYVGQAEETAERFEPDGWSGEPGARLYRTGDLGQYTEGGEIRFVGRADRQVKIRGYRVELGEIEEVLRQQVGLKEVRVVWRREEGREGRLIGYVQGRRQGREQGEQWSREMRKVVPEYQVPGKWVVVERWPLTENGKIDWRVLREQEEEQEAGGEERKEQEVGRSPMEELVQEIWQEVLGVQEVGLDENFFELGGHSLLATRIIARVRAVVQVEVSIVKLFERPTVAGLAQEIERRLRGGRGEGEEEERALEARARPQQVPLSFAQQRLWFLDQLEPESTAYLLPRVQRLQGPLDIAALKQSLEALTQRHEILRTTFSMHDDQGVQIIHPSLNLNLPLIDLSHLQTDVQETMTRRLINQEAQHPCNLTTGPLLRVALVRLATREHILLLTMHHIITDAWSYQIFVSELTTFYRAFHKRQPSPLKPLPLQYADFAIWQRQWWQGKVLSTQQTYWQRQLANIAPLELPTDHTRPAVQRYRGAFQSAYLPLTLSKRLTAMSRQQDVTLFMLLLAAFSVLLARYADQTDISIGTPIANRSRSELEGVIGFFVNTLVLRIDLSNNPSFLDLLKHVREVALGAYAHQDVPFEQLVELLQPARDLSRPPLFQVMFSVAQQERTSVAQQERTSVERQALVNEEEQLLVQPFHAGHETEEIATKFDLELNILHGEQGLFCAVIYNRDLFESSSIQRMLAHFAVLLEHIATEPAHPIASLPLLTAAERQQILVDWNQTQRPAPQPHSFVHLFTAQAAAIPTRLAVMDGVTRLTYRELDQRANQLAHWLRDVGVQPEELVGIHMSRSVEFLVAVLGVFKAGGAYVPLDPAYPSAHLAFICADARIQILITQPNWRDALPITPRAICYLAPTFQALEAYSKDAVPVEAGGEQLAYVIYTSGSTGRPKGAMVTQRGMLNHLWAKVETLELTQHDIVAQTASPCFDISVWQMLSAFLVGGQVCMIPDQITHDPVGLFERIATSSLTILEVVPSLLRAYLEEIEREDRPGGQPWLTSLRWLVVTGEQLSVETGQRWQQRYPGIALLNAYGPTECSDDVTHARLTADVIDKVANVPIGRAIANTQLYLLSEGMEPVPVGVPGQIYVGGMGVGRGYLGEAERTALAFVPNPFGRQEGERLYRTGDLGRYRADGQIEFLRRIDQQVKLRGYRIELGEIEAVLRAHPAIGECVVMLREEQGDAYLTAYVVGRGAESAPARPELISYLQERLPQYMLPAAVVVLSELPLTSNGKIDRRALPVPEKRDGVEEGKSQQIMTPFEEVLQGIWCEVLKKERIDLQANFFDLGGHSLLATQLISRIRSTLHVEVTVRMVFESPTIAQLAQQIEQALRVQQKMESTALIPVPRTAGLPLSFAQQRLWFIDQLEPGNVAYLIPLTLRLEGPFSPAALEWSLNEIVRRHESLRTAFRSYQGQPLQFILDPTKVDLPLIDLSHLCSSEASESLAQALVQQTINQPFDLELGSLLRARFLRLHRDEHVLVFVMHHIVSDGWSMNIFMYELALLYRSFVEGKAYPLPELPIQYADFAYWQRQSLQGETLEALLAYWTDQLTNSVPLKLPTDHSRSESSVSASGDYLFAFAEDVSQDIVAFSRQKGVTLFMTLLAAFQTLLYRYTGQTDIVLGTDMAGRAQVEVEALIGFFINLLVLRNDLSGSPSFAELLTRTREVVLGAYTHQDAPFEMVVERLLPEQSEAHMPFIQGLFVLQNQPEAPVEAVPGLVLKPFSGAGTTPAKFDLAVFMVEGSRSLRCGVKYNRALFEEQTIVTMMHRFEVLLRNIVAHPDMPIDILDFYTEAEKAKRAQQSKLSLRKLKEVKKDRGNKE